MKKITFVAATPSQREYTMEDLKDKIVEFFKVNGISPINGKEYVTVTGSSDLTFTFGPVISNNTYIRTFAMLQVLLTSFNGGYVMYNNGIISYRVSETFPETRPQTIHRLISFIEEHMFIKVTEE